MTDAATKFIVVTFGFILMMIVSISVMVYGWGLEPQSWWWIIGGGIFIRLIIAIMELVGKGG
jgi:membrane protein YdbS with pleckstrin-like domain